MTRRRRAKTAVDVCCDATAAIPRTLTGFVDEASPVPVDSVLDLLAHLDDPGRRLPVVIISIGSRASRHGVPPQRLARELAGMATVWALPTPEMSRHLSARPELETYGGAVRVVGRTGWSKVIRTDRGGAETAIRRITQAVRDATAADPARPKLTLVPDLTARNSRTCPTGQSNQ